MAISLFVEQPQSIDTSRQQQSISRSQMQTTTQPVRRASSPFVQQPQSIDTSKQQQSVQEEQPKQPEIVRKIVGDITLTLLNEKQQSTTRVPLVNEQPQSIDTTKRAVPVQVNQKVKIFAEQPQSYNPPPKAEPYNKGTSVTYDNGYNKIEFKTKEQVLNYTPRENEIFPRQKILDALEKQRGQINQYNTEVNNYNRERRKNIEEQNRQANQVTPLVQQGYIPISQFKEGSNEVIVFSKPQEVSNIPKGKFESWWDTTEAKLESFTLRNEKNPQVQSKVVAPEGILGDYYIGRQEGAKNTLSIIKKHPILSIGVVGGAFALGGFEGLPYSSQKIGKVAKVSLSFLNIGIAGTLTGLAGYELTTKTISGGAKEGVKTFGRLQSEFEVSGTIIGKSYQLGGNTAYILVPEKYGYSPFELNKMGANMNEYSYPEPPHRTPSKYFDYENSPLSYSKYEYSQEELVKLGAGTNKYNYPTYKSSLQESVRSRLVSEKYVSPNIIVEKNPINAGFNRFDELSSRNSLDSAFFGNKKAQASLSVNIPQSNIFSKGTSVEELRSSNFDIWESSPISARENVMSQGFDIWESKSILFSSNTPKESIRIGYISPNKSRTTSKIISLELNKSKSMSKYTGNYKAFSDIFTNSISNTKSIHVPKITAINQPSVTNIPISRFNIEIPYEPSKPPEKQGFVDLFDTDTFKESRTPKSPNWWQSISPRLQPKKKKSKKSKIRTHYISDITTFFIPQSRKYAITKKMYKGMQGITGLELRR